MRDKVKLHFLVCLSQEMLVEPIGHLGAVYSHLDLLYSLEILNWEFYGTLHAG
ncbi:hypothetical protein JOC94_003820 [Bacillus thermophilus]|uniref:Uncharacterized protein n=1 Tax=Siminovitchia thermophila TaxID=1245522 RepID=A0ABS2RAV7_9BACI|nr:hypothetical protein [Siminovitchia thermophila]